ncbi:hypothetical protein KJ567_01550 [Candidatus Bipolaricaulota bacterium]|nr:hypothetical protein [Candidatus Bipolaricaulota bacterium]
MTRRMKENQREPVPDSLTRVIVGRYWLIAVLVVSLATAAAAAILRHRVPASSIGAKQQEILTERPEIILLGNSLLDEGIDTQTFAESVGRRTLKWASGGSASAYWYLALKNVIAPCEHVPQWAIVFFSDTLLTQPSFRVTGNYRDLIERLALPEEPILHQLAYGTSSSRWARAVEKYWSLYGGRHLLRDYAEMIVKRATAALASVGEPDLADATRSTFRPENLDPMRFTALQADADSTDVADFTEKLARSLLPHMIDVMAEAGIGLGFVRVPLRRDALGQPQSAELIEYIAELADYLASRGVPLIDLSKETPLSEEQFADGNHIDRETGSPPFTRLAAETLRRELAL